VYDYSSRIQEKRISFLIHRFDDLPWIAQQRC